MARKSPRSSANDGSLDVLAVPLGARCHGAYPLSAMQPGYDVPNFHRIVVHGSTFPLEYLKLTIDPHVDAPASDTAFGPFAWTRVQP
jgi:hypothetical protein